MALKSVLDSLEGVNESLHEHYAERDGKFHLNAEGMVSKDRLSEFRDNNVALKRQLDDLNSRFDGIDPDRFRELSEKAAKERDRKLVDAGKIDELVAERVAAMKADADKQIQSLTADRDATRSRLESLVIDGAIRDAGAKAGVRPTAIEDVLLRGRQTFKLQDGQAVAMDGDKVIFGKDGNPMPIAEWVDGLASRAPHLFGSTTGTQTPAGSVSSAPGVGRVSRGDANGFLNNLDGIISGAVKVV